MKALQVRDLCKTYVVNKRQNNVLRNVNLDIEDGELVAVMGPSGAGKTTLLYCASCMDTSTAGKIVFYDELLSDRSEKELSEIRLGQMGFIFQNMHMLKNLTIKDNILLPAYQAKGADRAVKRQEADERAQKYMHTMGILDIAENDITEVSGGQLQRACICRSLINNPKMIFADEPTGSLNKQASHDVMEEILKLNREGTTVMLVTHDVKVAAKASRVLYIADGSVLDDMNLGAYEGDHELKDRERLLNNWLLEKGW